jgi:hypothetical protein
VVFIAEYSYIVNTFGQLSIISPQINSGHYTHDILLGIDKFIVFGKWKALIIGLSHTFHFKESGLDIVIPTVLVFVLWTAFIVYKLRGGQKRRILTTFFTMLILIQASVSIFLAYYCFRIGSDEEIFLRNMDTNSHSTFKALTYKNHKSLFIIEPIITSKNDFSNFNNAISKNEIKRIFISREFINSLRYYLGKKRNVQGYISDLKDRHNLTFYCDLEANFGDLLDPYPPQLAIASQNDLNITYYVSKEYGSKLKETFFIDYVFGPVLDRKLSSRDTTILNRTFGVDPMVIYLNSCAVVLGVQDAGIKCILKHFPGHPQLERSGNNPHYSDAYTSYSTELLKKNSLPFRLLQKNPLINANIMMTDHVKISQISKKIPYTVFVNTLGHGGVNLASDLFLETKSNDIIFIADDIGMLLKHKKNNKEDALPLLAKQSKKAFLSGHDLVLIRNLKLGEFNKFFENFDLLMNDPTLIKAVFEKQKKVSVNTGGPLSMPKLIEENGVLQKTSQINYCLKINCSSEFLAKAKLGNLLNKKLLLISTCYNIDDFSNIFMAADNVDKHVLKSIDAQRFEKKTRALSDKILNGEIDLNAYDYIVVGSHSALSNKIIASIYKKLLDRSSAEKLIVFLLNTPDIIYNIHPKDLEYSPKPNSKPFHINISDIIPNANIFCFFSNSVISTKNVKKILGDGGIEKCLPLRNLTINLSDFYYCWPYIYSPVLGMNEVFRKICFGASESGVIKKSTTVILLAQIYIGLIFLIIFKAVIYSIYSIQNKRVDKK